MILANSTSNLDRSGGSSPSNFPFASFQRKAIHFNQKFHEHSPCQQCDLVFGVRGQGINSGVALFNQAEVTIGLAFSIRARRLGVLRNL